MLWRKSRRKYCEQNSEPNINIAKQVSYMQGAKAIRDNEIG